MVRYLVTAVVVLASVLAAGSSPVGSAVPGLEFTETTCQEHSDSVARLYAAAFDRQPEKGGFEFWLTEYVLHRKGLPEMAEFFASSTEFNATYSPLNDGQFVRQVYRNVLGREGDAGGISFWTGQLTSGLSRGQILLRFSESPENVQITGTTEPALGFYNEGLSFSFPCGLATPDSPSEPGTATPTPPAPTPEPPATEPEPQAEPSAVHRVRNALDAAEVVSAFDPSPSYDRDDYDGRGYADDDGDCINARHETLIDESLVQVTMTANGCSVSTGRWRDPYDGSVHTQASNVQIDHLVPLAHAHRAGAWRWNDATKRAFNSDIGIPATLAVAGGSSNSSKGDRSPDAWKPSDRSAWCLYAIDWIDVKTRWDLPYLVSEANALDAMLDTCTDASIPDRTDPAPAVASIVIGATAPEPTPPAPDPTPTPSAPSPPSGTRLEITRCDVDAEIVTIKNSGGTAVTLNGYVLTDESVHRFEMDGIRLSAGEDVDVISGRDPVAGPGQVIGWENNIWNNDGDTATITGPSGEVVDSLRCR